MATDNQTGVQIGVASGGLPKEKLRLLGAWGTESLSRLFEYDLVFSRPKKAPFTFDELDTLMGTPFAITLGPKPGDVVHGVVRSIKAIDPAASVQPRYRARLVPTAWLLTLNKTNRVFQQVTIPDLLRAVLGRYGFAEGKNFDMRVMKPGPVREYIVQFCESDWDFLQRWMEHEGLFYWFEHGETSEKLVISDENSAATAIEDPSILSHRERNNLLSGAASVWDFTFEQKRVPARVAVLDYNYRNPSVDLLVKQDVDTKRGFGSVHLWGEHFKTNDEGQLTATARAQRHLTERVTFTGSTDCSRFRVGHSFKLENHYNGDLDQKYLITEISHGVGIPLSDDKAGSASGQVGYRGTFSAIPLATQFRPERVTPWPRIDGVITAHIEADGDGKYAQVDSMGRYKVRLPFDGGNAKGSKASRWCRMAAHYSGAGYGSHFPMHKGAEVLLVHVNGDPDRPIIAAAVPNAHTVTPSTASNATQSVIHTASGMKIVMEDRQS